MVFGYKKVCQALNGMSTGTPPKGELLISDEFIYNSPCPDVASFMHELNADLITLPANNYDKNLIKYWYQKELFVFNLFDGPFSVLINTLGLPKAFHDIVKNPKSTEKFMRDFIFKVQINKIYKALDNGCHGLIIADDIAGNDGLLISPEYLNLYYFPLIHDLINNLSDKKFPVVFHSDGNIISILASLYKCGFNGFHGLQPSVGISPSCLNKLSFSDLIFWGNFELESGSVMKTHQEVISEIPKLLEGWSGYPAYIFGTSGGLYKGLDPSLIVTAYKAIDGIKTTERTGGIRET